MRLSDSKFLSKLTGRKLAAVEALLDSPAASKALETAESKIHTRRRELIAALKIVEEPHKAPMLAAQQAYEAGRDRRIAAEIAYRSAIEDEGRLFGLSHASNHVLVRARAEIETELRETADPRIADFEFFLSTADSGARASLNILMEVVLTTGNKGRTGIPVTNVAEVEAARDVIAACRAECAQMRESLALTYAEITTRFESMRDKLKAPLGALELSPPFLTEDGAVRAPLRWAARNDGHGRAAQQPAQSEPVKH